MNTPTKTNEELEKGIRCVVYDMLLLAAAVVQMGKRAKILKGIGLSKNEVALETALVKFRCLHDFLVSRKPKQGFDNILADEFGVNMPKQFEARLRLYRDSIGTFACHLDWQRALRKGRRERPKPKDMPGHALTVLARADEFIAKATRKKYKLTGTASRYYERFKVIFAELKERSTVSPSS